MSEPFLSEPARWSDQATSGTDTERALGAQLGRVREATEPSPAALHRLSVRRNRGVRVGSAPRILRVAVVVVVIVAMGSAVGAALASWRHIDVIGMLGLGRRPAPTDDAEGGARRLARARRTPRGPEAMHEPARSGRLAPAGESPASGAAGTPVVAPVVLPAPGARPRAPMPTTIPMPIPTPRPTALPTRETPRATDSLALAEESSEAGILAHAFRELRSGSDPTVVLLTLNEYDRRFPRGALRGEARIARAEALVAGGRRLEALPLLEDVEANGGTLTRDLRITRAELSAEAGRCSEAVSDFDELLTSPKVDAVAERALFGRASCYLRFGVVGAARADLERYLVLHPDGPSAISARRALQSMP